MDAWGTLDIGAAVIVRDDLGTSIRRTKKFVSITEPPSSFADSKANSKINKR